MCISSIWSAAFSIDYLENVKPIYAITQFQTSELVFVVSHLVCLFHLFNNVILKWYLYPKMIYVLVHFQVWRRQLRLCTRLMFYSLEWSQEREMTTSILMFLLKSKCHIVMYYKIFFVYINSFSYSIYFGATIGFTSETLKYCNSLVTSVLIKVPLYLVSSESL